MLHVALYRPELRSRDVLLLQAACCSKQYTLNAGHSADLTKLQLRDNWQITKNSQPTWISGDKGTMRQSFLGDFGAQRNMLPSQIMQNCPPLKWPRYPKCTDLRALTRVRRRSRYWECCAACFDTKQMISPWCLQQMIIHNPCVSINIMGLSQVVMFCKYESKVTGRLCSHSPTIRYWQSTYNW